MQTRCPAWVVVRALVGSAALVALAAAPAAAEPRTDAGLVWQAPEACPDAQEVRARIERRLGMSLDAVHGIEVDIASDGARFVARVDLRGVTVANDVRTLTSVRCDELTDAIAVIVARLAAERHNLGWDEEPPAVTRAEPEPIAPPPPPNLWGGGVRALALSGIGALPHINVGGELAAFVRHETMFVELAGGQWSVSNKGLQPGAPASVGVSLTVATLRLGWIPVGQPLRAWGGLEVGEMTGAGMALGDPTRGSAIWAAADIGFGVAWPMTEHCKLVGSLEFAAVFARPSFVLADGVEVYQPAPLAARTAFGLEVGWN